MPKMDEKELLNLVENEFHTAMGAPGGDISQERADAWDYYLSKPFGNEIEGQSQVVSSDVADAVDGMMPSLLRIFTVSENLIDFDPVGPEDIEKAQQESDYVNHVFFKKNPAFLILYTWFFDALVQKNGIVKAWWDESEEVTTESYHRLTDENLAELMDDEELEPIERDEVTEELAIEEALELGFQAEAEQAVLEIQERVQAGEIIEEAPTVSVTFTDIKFKRTKKSGRVRVEPVPPEEYRISADAHSLDPSAARMVGQERHDATRSELIEMGFPKDVVNDLPAHSLDNESIERASRYNKSDEEDDFNSDSSQDTIHLREGYVRVDYDGDGISELRQVIIAGNKILLNEEVDRQPFHVISPQPLPHKHFGRAWAEKVMDVQQITSTLTRQALDNLYYTNNPEQNVWEQAMGENTLDDLLTRRAGKVNRFSRPVSEAYSVNAVPFTAGASFPMLEYYEKVKRDRTGVNADGEGLNPEQLKHIQTSVLSQANDLSRMKIEAVVRIFAETGVKSLFRHIHELILKHQQREEVVLLRNQWVSVNPQEWRTRNDMTVRIGLGVGTKEQNLIHLNAIWEKQAAIVEKGGAGTLVTPANIYNTAAEFVKNANLKSPDMFFTNPANVQQQPEQPDPMAQAQLQLQQRAVELEAQDNEIDRERNLLNHQREVEKLKLQQQKQENDRQKQQDELMVKMEDIANKLTELELKYSQDIPGSRV